MTDAAHIKPLTALRFFAAFWVVMYHYWPNLAVVGAVPGVVAKGYLGVEAFFVLSGFILCHVYLTAFGEGRFGYGGFLWNRLARVYPLHLFTMAGVGLMAVAAGIAGIAVDKNMLAWDALPANLLMVQAWGFAPVSGWNHPSWSISAEWFAYLSFPAFAFVAWNLRNRPLVLLGAALAVIAALYPTFEKLAGFPLTEATIRWGALRIVPCFFYGCALYTLWKSQTLSLRGAGIGAVVAGVLLLATVQLQAPDALIVAILGGFILSLARLAKAGSSFATQSIFVYLGEISYSTYMICIPWKILAVNGAAKLLNIEGDKLPLLVWVLIVAALIPLSAASYHLVEKPARDLMKSLAKRRSGAATTVTVAQ